MVCRYLASVRGILPLQGYAGVLGGLSKFVDAFVLR